MLFFLGRGSYLLGLFLLLLLFFVLLLLLLGRGSSSARPNFFLTVGNELVDGLGFATGDDSVDVVVRNVGSDASEEGLDICSF